MPSLKEYFDKQTYKSSYKIGDRVKGKWNKIPFVGTVLNDSLTNYEEGQKTSIYLDLPIKYKNEFHVIIFAKNKDISFLK